MCLLLFLIRLMLALVEVATSVGETLLELASSTQVIAITHSMCK